MENHIPLQPMTAEEFPENTALPEGVREVRWQDTFGYGVALAYGVVYAQRGDKPLHLHYLTPRNDRRDNPLIVYIQGSAWYQQDLCIHLPEMIRMCQRGYCVALVEYRPSTTAPFPAQCEDVKTAIRFLRSDAEHYRFDPERVAVWGDSSGGHTALMAGFTGDHCLNHPEDPDMSAEVRCIVDWYGPTVVSEMLYEPSLFEHTSPDCPEGWLIGHLPVHENLELAAATVPQSYVTADRPTPPTLIMHGSRDMTVNFQQSIHLYEKLRQLGKEVEFIKLLGADHGFRGFSCEEALNEVDTFLKKHL
ncbi:MAG: alpha/beta hydrolase [Clostridiales bacterium]|nr:alpha/beta hydrolase [Clostridiales bacterium]